jgi:hypothetical protein
MTFHPIPIFLFHFVMRRRGRAGQARSVEGQIERVEQDGFLRGVNRL